MAVPSQTLALDGRLLSAERFYQSDRHKEFRAELGALTEASFKDDRPNIGVFWSLSADLYLLDAQYRKALDAGLKAAKYLADYPLNSRYGRAVLTVSKAYYALGDLKNAEIRARDSLAAYRRAGDVEGQVGALNNAARVAYTRCDYSKTAELIDEAIVLADGDPLLTARLTGNAGAVKVFSGDWAAAEANLTSSLQYNRDNDVKSSQVVNLLALASLYIRKREFVFAADRLADAERLIDELNLKRERVIHAEFAGQLALEKGDTSRARHILSEAYSRGKLIAPESALVSQTGRLLAEAELALDNIDEAMKYAQKALELALRLGERSEVGMARRIIALVFASRGDYKDALKYAAEAVDQLRQVNDVYLLGRTLLSYGEILAACGIPQLDKINQPLDEATKIFRTLGVGFFAAEARFLQGSSCCRQGELSLGFACLNEAEKIYSSLGEQGKVRGLRQFLGTVADQAVAYSLSTENEYKVFGNLLSHSELSEVRAGQMAEVLGVVIQRTAADQAILYSPESSDRSIASCVAMSPEHERRFVDSFDQLLGEEVSRTRPTLLLDCRRDPYINELFPGEVLPIASVIVVPCRMSDQSTSFLYVHRLSRDNELNPFSQSDLNFAVGYSDLLVFKAAELQKARLLEDNRRLRSQLRQETAFPNILTCNTSMIEMLAQIRQVVDSNISLAIEGETGCGKDLLARAIHYNSARRNKRFISVNCAALPETLLESELFGYKRGAFTGADRDKPGLFEEADGGTFFLDEIADMPLSVQAKLLRVLEAKEIVRLGESTPRPVDVRIVSATNKILKEEMAANRFRQDLYYRLTALTFSIPPLRERKDDIPLLIDHFLEGSGKTVSAGALQKLVAYDWPGNIRELENEIKKLILLAGDSDTLDVAILSSRIAGSGESGSELMVPLTPPGQVTFSKEFSLYDYLAGFEKDFIVKALREHGGIKKHAAASLNIPESTLRLKIKQYNIDLDADSIGTVN